MGVNGVESKNTTCRHALVPIRIGEKRCIALADAGATITLMSTSLAKELRLPLYPPRLSATGVTNDALRMTGRTAARIRLGTKTISHCIYVADQISHDVILGTDYLAKLGEVTYNFKTCTLKTGNDEIPMVQKRIGITVDAVIHIGQEVQMVESLQLPPLSETIVTAEVNSVLHKDDIILFEGNNNTTPRSILVGKAVDQPKNGTVRFPIMNTSPNFQTIQANTVIGNVEKLEEDIRILGTGDKPDDSYKRNPGDALKIEDTDLSKDQMKRLKNLINKYKDIIGERIEDLGSTKIVQHVIETLPNTQPIRSRPYNIPVHLRAEVKSQIDKMLDQGLITMSTGSWSSPIVLVKKKDGSWRFCVDYRKLNAVTVKHSMALSNIENAMEIMHGKKYFSSIDLCSGFFQVSLHEDSREKSAFITPWGTYRWQVMPQGASGSPSTFARLALAIMSDLISQGSSCVYLDDWLMCSRTFDEHIALLDTVFNRLRYAGLKYRLSKSYFCQRKITYLGHVISQDGITVAPHNTTKIANFPTPKDKSGVRRMLGLFSFYRSYIKDFSKVANALIKLTKKDEPFVWTEDCEKAAQYLKDRITSAPILIFPNFNKQFVLTTDASSIAIGAVLSQEGEDGKLHPVSFYSKALSVAEQKWDACEQELFAILCAVKHYRAFLMNTHFLVLTDNVACTYIVKKSDLSPRLARWAVQLADYSFDIQHKAGKENVVADALSRAEEVNAIDSDPPINEEDTEMAAAQSRDYYLSPIKLYLTKKKFPVDTTKREMSVIKEKSLHFKMIKGVVYRVKGDKLLLAIPASQRQDLLYSAHESLMAMHPGLTKTMLKLSDKYWFPHMRKEVGRHIARCGSCQQRKDPKQPIRVPLKNQYASSPFDVISVDFMGPLTPTDSNKRNILVWTDHFTRWCEIQATEDQLASTVAQSYVERIFCRFGCSRVLLSDRAKNFLSEVIENINTLLQVEHRKTTPYRPQTNGLSEVTNRTIGTMLSHVVAENHRDWDKYIPLVQLAHNSARHTTINASPSMLLMCREVRFPYDMTQPSLPERVKAGTYAASLHKRMAEVWSTAKEAIEDGKTRQKGFYDRKCNASDLQVGDCVYYWTPRGQIGRTKKLMKRWKGPYIIKKLTDTNATIQLFNDPDQVPFVVHLNTLKRYKGPLLRGSSHELSIDLGYSPGSDSSSDSDDENPAETPVDNRSRNRHYEVEDTSVELSRRPDSSLSDYKIDRAKVPNSTTDSKNIKDGIRGGGCSLSNGEDPSLESSNKEPATDKHEVISRPTTDDIHPPDNRDNANQRDRGEANGRYSLRRRPKRKREAGFVYTT